MGKDEIVVVETKRTAATSTNVRRIMEVALKIVSIRKDPFTALVRMILIWIAMVERVS